MRTMLCAVSASITMAIASSAMPQTELTLLDQFSTSGGIGLAFAPLTDTIWTYGGDVLREYDRTGTLLNTIASAPGESANDADLDMADVEFVLGTTRVPAGTLLFTNGETDEAEVYAIDASGTVVATLNSSFGNSHVVGSAFSPSRGTFYMLQDRVPSAELDNVVANVDAQSGAVLDSFDLDDIESDFSVNFGDLEVHAATGNLLVVSNAESSVLEVSPAGVELSRWVLAQGSGGSLAGSGIALDDGRNELYVQTQSGTVYRYAILPDCPTDLDGSGVTGFSDLTALLKGWGACANCPPSCAGDLDGDCSASFSDLTELLVGWGPC